MANKLFIGNLSYSVDQDGLADLFSGLGTVDSVKIITDRNTGRSKGFGFVEMSTESEAQACIQEFDGKEYQGRQISISIAKPQAPRNDDRRGGGGGGFRSRY